MNISQQKRINSLKGDTINLTINSTGKVSPLTVQNTQVDIEANDNNNSQPAQIQPIPTFSTHQSHTPKESAKNNVRLDFCNVCLDVNTKVGVKRILNNVSGYVLPGEMLYIMGPSGSGKTTLLDFLCNRTQKDPKQDVFLNKQQWSKTESQKISRYCQQHPQLYEILTVQETLEYAASFFTNTKDQLKERVENVINLLGLENQRDTKIGGIFYRGISGGQKQRVSVGEQLVANPKLLFLDEPTSGLDSATAFQLMDNLKQICNKTGITIVCSIHQPSQRVFDLSDRLLILAGGKGYGGNVAYFGETRNIDRYFENLSIVNSSKSSISEWILDKVNGDFGKSEEIEQILQHYEQSEQKNELNQVEKELRKHDIKYKYEGQITKQSYIKDVMILLKRGFINNIKNPLALLLRIAVYCAMGAVLGSVWWQNAQQPDAGDISNISGVLFFMASFFAVMSISVLPINIEDRLIMVKEKTNGAYKLSAYSLSHFLVSTPITLLIAVLAGSVIYFMVGFTSNYPLFILNLFICLVASEGLIFIISSVFSHLLISIVITAFIMGSFMIMNGFFIKTSKIPDSWIWLHYGAYNTFTFQNFMVGAYRDITIGKNLDIVPPAIQDYSGNLVLKGLDMEDVDVSNNIWIQVGFILLFRLIAYIYSYFKHTGKK